MSTDANVPELSAEDRDAIRAVAAELKAECDCDDLVHDHDAEGVVVGGQTSLESLPLVAIEFLRRVGEEELEAFLAYAMGRIRRRIPGV